jgi:hypothetical protein
MSIRLLLAIVIIAVVAVLGSRIISRGRRLPFGLTHLLVSGTAYIFLGLILGPKVLDVFDRPTLDQLQPALLFALAWIGFLFGLQFEIRQLRRLPRFYFSITAVQALVTFVTVTLPIYLLVQWFYPNSAPLFLLAQAVILGSAACSSAQSALAIAAQSRTLANRPLLQLLRYVSSVDGLFGLSFFALAIIAMSGVGGSGSPVAAVIQWILATLLMAGAPALILIILSRTRLVRQEFPLFLVGAVMLCAGMAHTMHHTPLISGLICGVLVANFSRHRLRALAVVMPSEKPIYLILLLIIGADWVISLDLTMVMLLAYFLLRLLGKLAGLSLATRIFRPQYPVPGLLGLGLASEGGLAIAIIVSYRLLHAGPVSDALVTIIIFSVLIGELLGPRMILALFKREGDR